jgi:hypothetical protein
MASCDHRSSPRRFSSADAVVAAGVGYFCLNMIRRIQKPVNRHRATGA